MKYKSLIIFSILIFSLDYAAQYAYDRDGYCLKMPRQDLEHIRETSKTFGDINVP